MLVGKKSSAWRQMVKTESGKIIIFEPDAVREYLDQCIRFWRKVDYPFARYYINAFQSVRVSLFGELLNKEKGEGDDGEMDRNETNSIS